MYVESSDRYAEVGEFDPETGTLVATPRSIAPEKRLVHGHFAKLSEDVCIFYRWKDDLWLRVGEQAWRLGETISLDWLSSDRISRLTLLESGKELVRLEYEVRDWIEDDDVTAFGSQEDFDFGLFVFNVMSDPRRRNAIYRGSGP